MPGPGARPWDIWREGSAERSTLGGFCVPALTRRVLSAALVLLCVPAAASAADVRAKVLAAYDSVKSYRITVLGSVRSTGSYLAPDRYRMTTVIDGKPLKTIFIGNTYWILTDGKWQKSDSTANSLDFDIAGLLRNAKQSPASRFVTLPGQAVDGKRVGAFTYTFKDGRDETCDYDLKTYLVSRCKAEDLTILYSGYNDPAIQIPHP
jgi:hypothetical protein